MQQSECFESASTIGPVGMTGKAKVMTQQKFQADFS